MTKDLFYQFGIKLGDSPIQHLKLVVESLKNTLAHEQNEISKDGYEIRIKNIDDFLKFVEIDSAQGTISFIEKTNIGEPAMGVETILLSISVSSKETMPDELKQKITAVVYAQNKKQIPMAYFRPTKIPNVFEWWEKGEAKQESFGTIADDALRGFVKIG